MHHRRLIKWLNARKKEEKKGGWDKLYGREKVTFPSESSERVKEAVNEQKWWEKLPNVLINPQTVGIPQSGN